MLPYIICWVHIIMIVFVSFYVFIFKRSFFDYIYLLYIYFVILHWTFLKGECIITYVYKKLKDKNYIAGENLQDNELISLLKVKHSTVKMMSTIHFLFIIINIVLIAKRNHIPNILYTIFLFLLIIMFGTSKYFKNHHRNKSFHLFLEIMKCLLIIFGIVSVWFLNKRKKFTKLF
jgi:hypothetical protein